MMTIHKQEEEEEDRDADWYVDGDNNQQELASKEFRKIGIIIDKINDGTYKLVKD